MAYLTAEDIEEIKKKKKKKQSSVNTPKYLTNKDVEEILNRKNNVNVAPVKKKNLTKQKEQEVIKQKQKELQTKTAFNTELNKKGVLTTGSTNNFSAPNLFTVANEQRKTIENGKLPTYQELKNQKKQSQENIAKYEDVVKTNPKYQEFKTEFYKTPQVEYEYDVEKLKNSNITKSDKVFSGFKSGISSFLSPRRVTQDENGNYVEKENYYELKNKKVYDNSSELGKLYNTATQTIGKMIPSMLVGGALGAAVKSGGAAVKGVKAARKIGSLGTLFINAAQDSTNQKLLDGYTKQEANQYGLMSGAIETATELLFGGMGKVFGTGALDNVITDKLTKGIKNKVLKTLGEAGISSVGEGIEEVIGNLLYPIADKIALNSDKSYSELLKDQNMTQDFLSAIISSAILSAPSSVVSYRNNINNENQPLESNTQTNVLDNTNRLEKQESALNEPKIANNELLPINENIKKEIPTIEDIMKIKKVGKFESPKIIQSSLDANEKYVLNTQDKVKRVGMTKDFYRNMRNLFNKDTADRVTGEFDEAKLNNVNLSNELANDLKENVVNKYNIQKGSKDSALIQKYGEGLIGEADLKKESPNNWQNIIEADKYFRKQYDMLIDRINASRKTIYPNVEKTILEYENKIQDTTQKIRSKQAELKATKKGTTKYENLKNQINSLHLKKQSYIATIESDEILRNKRVEKRQDYYRHFQEMAEGFNALRNILSTSSDIAPKMVGTSDFTKPNAKFSSITQRRTGNKTKYDAIGGLLDYIPTASFMINIDPQIYKFRKMTNDIKDQMGKETYANQAIQFMTEWTNGLAGKQNYIDRATQKTLDSLTWGQGRKAIKGLNWLSGRIKSNMILGNMSSTLSQSLNLPQVVGKVKNPKLLMQGLADTFNPNTDYSQSQFIMERYKSDIKSQFDTKLIEQPKKLAVWMLGALDQAVTKTGWNALYRQAIEKNMPNPIQYADNNIRDLVAGRGIGEKTIFQESKVIGTLMPFTVEVGNLNRVLKDFAREKDVAGLFILFIVANLLNKGIEEIGGSGKTFDPIEALKEALTEEDITVLERIGRVGGEVLSNIPIGQQIAALYPEYGNKDLGLPTRDKLFGDNDPTRFGTGSMYSKIFDDPVTTLITPWGGTQIKRTTDALKMYDKDLPGSYTDSGKLRFPVKDDKLTKVQAALFGQYASKEAREYFDKNRRPLSKNQVEEVKNSKDWKEAYNLILKQREYDALGRKYEKYVKEGKSTKELQKEIDNFWK